MSQKYKFKYDPVNPSLVNEILIQYKDQDVLEYIIDLYKLIDYQKELITNQEKQLVALKHTEAWKHYEK
jgi:hypothetical protein